MAEKTLDARVCLKYDTYESWKSKNTILKKGEVAQTYVSSTSIIDSTGKTLTASSSGTIPAGTILYKVGDGTNSYNSLKFTTAIPTDAAPKSHTHGEATLTWGGASIAGGIGPLATALSSEHSANRLAFLNPNAFYAERSNDGGETWEEYSLSAETKIKFVTLSSSLFVGSTTPITTNHRLRVTLTAQDGTNGYLYVQPRKLLINVSTAHGISVLIERKTGVTGANWITVATYRISGWSGWNDIPLNLSTFGGGSNQKSNNWYLRFTFIVTSLNSNASYASSYPQILGMRLFADNAWTLTNNMCKYGHIYSYDYLQNATFPAKVKATSGFDGGLLGTNNTTNADSYVWFSAQSTANEANASYMGKRAYNAKLKYNPSTDVLTVGSITGSASSATKATQDGNGDVIADTYVKKVTTTASFNRAYAITAQGKPVMINVANGSADANSIAQRYSNGRLLVGTPEVDGDATTKKYVDGALSKKQDTLSANSPLYIDSSNNIGINYDGNGIVVDSSNNLSVNWYNMPIDSSSPLYISCNGLSLSASSPLYANSCNIGINYGHGLNIFSEGYNQDVLGVDWSQLPVNSSTFYIDSSGLQITRPNNLLDIGLGNYTTYIQNYSCNSDTLSIVSDSIEIDAASSSGQIAIQGCNDIIIHNNNLGIIIDNDSNNLSIGLIDSSNNINLDYAYLQVDGSGVSVSHKPTASSNIANKQYVDDIATTKLDKTAVSVAADANTVAKRHGNGRLYVGAPTENYDAATKKYVDDATYNENILINGEFNVNQQGNTTYSTKGGRIKTVDMWIAWNGTGTFNASTKVLTNTGTSGNLILQQAIEYYGYLWGKTLTLTAKIDGVIYSATSTLPSSAPSANAYYCYKDITTSSGAVLYMRLRYTPDRTMMYADIGLGPNSSGATKPSITLGYVKLEYGSVSTPIRRGGWNTYSEELIKCQRYYQNIYTHDVTSYARSATSITISFRLPVMLRANPTLTERRTGTIVVGQGGSHAATKVAFAQMWSNIVRLTITTSGLVTNQVYVTNSGDFSLDANIL